ncbi:MAG TPA: glycosyltransferase family 39 protein [Thermoanaerobaculia bacterium]
MKTDESDGHATLWYAVTAGVLVTLAAAVRFGHLGATLFEDEVWVANLLRDGDYAPHTYNTPPLFYYLGRIWTKVRGFSDVALREPAAFFGVALCALPFAAPRPRLTRILWSLLLAFSSPLLFYSTRLKQYTIEAFVITLLIVVFLHALERDRARLWIAFFAIAIAAVMLLHSPVFIVAAAGAVAVVKVRRPWIAAGFLAAGAAFVVAWVAYMAPGPKSVVLHGDMEQWFTETGRWIDSPASLLRNSVHWLGQAFNMTRFWWLVLPVLMLWWIVRKRPWIELALALLPVLAVVAASMLHRYPYGEVRLMIFCFPALYLLAAEAIAEASRRVPLVLLVVAPFLFNGVARDTYNATYMRLDDLRTILDTIAAAHRPGEPVYADLSHAAPLHYYLPQIRPDLRAVTVAAPAGAGWYVQHASRFTAPQTGLRMRIGDTVAVRVP